MLHAVVMAGGSGTRFWPESRREFPKQFLKIGGDRTLLQETVERCQPLVGPDKVWIVTGSRYVGRTREQLPQLDPRQIIEEPCPRNTAPCLGLAALQLVARDPEAVLLAVAADHVIRPQAYFAEAVRTAAAFIGDRPESCVLFGAIPTVPATGFGYIEQGEEFTGSSVRKVESFREKPSREVAEEYLATGNYLWNCGIFVWRAQSLLDALASYQPQIHQLLTELRPHVGTVGWQAAVERCFPQMPSISIDYAVLEHSPDVAVVPARFSWDDIGSWQAMARLRGGDEQGNTVLGQHVGWETRDCIVRGSEDHLIATAGVQDLIVVHTPDATLVVDRHDENAVKNLLSEVERRGFGKYL